MKKSRIFQRISKIMIAFKVRFPAVVFHVGYCLIVFFVLIVISPNEIKDINLSFSFNTLPLPSYTTVQMLYPFLFCFLSFFFFVGNRHDDSPSQSVY